MITLASATRLASALLRGLSNAAHRAASGPVGLFEDNLLVRAVASKAAYPPTFIIGAPRTGSTILYQAITNAYDVSYIDNVACPWHRNLLFGLWLSERTFGAAPHNNFEAEHGNTGKFGGHAPSECGEFWYRWCPRDRHFLDHRDVTATMITDIAREISAVTRYFNKPIVIKNLNAGQRLRLIAKAFPDARIIFVRRDPVFVLRSILRARATLGIGQGHWWSVKPQNYAALLSLPEIDMCAGQIFHIERQIEEDMQLFEPSHVRTVCFHDFSSAVVNDLAQWLNFIPRPGGVLPPFRADNRNSLDRTERRKLSLALSKFFPLENDR